MISTEHVVHTYLNFHSCISICVLRRCTYWLSSQAEHPKSKRTSCLSLEMWNALVLSLPFFCYSLPWRYIYIKSDRAILPDEWNFAISQHWLFEAFRERPSTLPVTFARWIYFDFTSRIPCSSKHCYKSNFALSRYETHSRIYREHLHRVRVWRM